MIKLNLYTTSDNKFILESESHGSEIVCAAYSTLQFAFLNAIHNLTKKKPVYSRIKPKSGRVEVCYKMPAGKDNESIAKVIQWNALVTMFVEGVRWIMADAPNDIQAKYGHVSKKMFKDKIKWRDIGTLPWDPAVDIK